MKADTINNKLGIPGINPINKRTPAAGNQALVIPTRPAEVTPPRLSSLVLAKMMDNAVKGTGLNRSQESVVTPAKSGQKNLVKEKRKQPHEFDAFDEYRRCPTGAPTSRRGKTPAPSHTDGAQDTKSSKESASQTAGAGYIK